MENTYYLHGWSNSVSKQLCKCKEESGAIPKTKVVELIKNSENK